MLSQHRSRPVVKEAASILVRCVGLLWAGTSDLSGFAVLMQFHVLSKGGSVSDSIQLWANQYILINYSSTCYIIPGNNHLYFRPVGIFPTYIPMMYLLWPIFKINTAYKSQLNSVDLSTGIYVLVTKFLWKYTYMFSALLQINFHFLFSHCYSKGKSPWVQLCSNYLGPCIKGEGNRHYRDDSAEPSSDGWSSAAFWPYCLSTANEGGQPWLSQGFVCWEHLEVTG